MKKLFLVLAFCVVNLNGTLDHKIMSVLCSIPILEIPRALNKLNEMEAECDADWQVYYHILPSLINQYNLKRGAEVGIFMGSHCKRILETTQVTKLYGIDSYVPYCPEDTLSVNYYDLFYNKVKDKMSVFGERFTLIRNFSHVACNQFKDGELDFVFIDGDHSYEAVKTDLECWYNKVRDGGIVAGDDYATRHPGVPRAVNEFFGKKGLKVNICAEQPRVWWVVKP